MDTTVTTADTPEVFFFGCKAPPHAAGHSLYSKRTSSYRLKTPWGDSLDGGLLRPKGEDGKPDYNARGDTTPRNAVVLDQKDGWTAVSFWDRSGDQRAASNSAFVVHAIMEAPEVLKLAREQWPEIFERPNFPVPRHNGRRIHCLPIDDGYFTGTEPILHCAQVTCWCHPTPQEPGAPHVYAHHAKDCREAIERAARPKPDALPDTSKPGWLSEMSERDEGPSPGWILIGEDF